jgi:hypothetical protein
VREDGAGEHGVEVRVGVAERRIERTAREGDPRDRGCAPGDGFGVDVGAEDRRRGQDRAQVARDARRPAAPVEDAPQARSRDVLAQSRREVAAALHPSGL